MGDLIITILIILILLVLKVVFQIKIKRIKEIAQNQELDEEVKKYPTNTEITKSFLEKLKNKKVEIEEDEQASTTMYIAVSNKILIGNLRNSFTRIQTLAHECLHSIQNRRILLFNYWFSIFYLLYFGIICSLTVFQKLPYPKEALIGLILFGFVYYFIRSYLENDAMIKARFLAKEYMEEIKISSKEKIQQIVETYDQLNQIGIPCVNYQLFFNTMLKVIVFILLNILL